MTEYKYIIKILSGVFLCYIGYKLFITGTQESSTKIVYKLGNMTLEISKATPGTIGLILGTVIIVTAIFFSSPSPCNKKEPEKPTADSLTTPPF